jgi:uncharacterized protein YunC (DUF1805 family)
MEEDRDKAEIRLMGIRSSSIASIKDLLESIFKETNPEAEKLGVEDGNEREAGTGSAIKNFQNFKISFI